MYKKSVCFIILIVAVSTFYSTLNAQKYASGLIERGIIDIVIIDTTEQALADATFFRENGSMSFPNEYIYFNSKYQIEIDTINIDEYVKYYLDIESGLKYIYYESTSSKVYTVDSFAYNLKIDPKMNRLMDSVKIVFNEIKKKTPKILIDGYQCNKIEHDQVKKGEEGYFRMYVTDEIETKLEAGGILNAVDGYPLQIWMPISKECEFGFGVKSLRNIDPQNEIFVRPTGGYKLVSLEEFNETVYQ
jgi:hypothetical protein